MTMEVVACSIRSRPAVVGNTTDQGADASILNRQININAPVAIVSPGANGGDVSQSNEATNTAEATNGNVTDAVRRTRRRTADASADSGSAGVAQDQSAGVDNGTDQQADASVDNEQVNVNLPVAVLSPHADGGDVAQSNEATNAAEATNRNATDQVVIQDQSGAATTDGSDHGSGELAAVDQDQTADVSNGTQQVATAPIVSEQSNSNESAGSGDVTQSNEAVNSAEATNGNATDQDVDQAQQAEASAIGGDAGREGHGKGDDKDQGTGDDAAPVADVTQDQVTTVVDNTDQYAAAPIPNEQSNSNEPADRKGGKGKGKGHGPAPAAGDMAQSNEAVNAAAATNRNATDQTVGQDQAAAATAVAADDVDRTQGRDPKGHDPKGHDGKGHGTGDGCEPEWPHHDGRPSAHAVGAPGPDGVT